MKQLKAKSVALLIALMLTVSMVLGACGDSTATPAATTAPAATTSAATTAAATTAAATTAAATTVAMTTAATTTAATTTTAAATTAAMTTTTAMTTSSATTVAGTTSATGSTDSVNVNVNGTSVVIKAGGGQTFKPANPVTLTMWSSQTKGNGQALRKLMDAFEASHPNIKVTIDNNNDTFTYDAINAKLAQAATAGGLPNIATGYENWVPAFVNSKVILGLNQFISGPYGLSAKDLSDYRPQMLARGIFPQYNNETYTWIFSNSGPVLYYNQDLLTQAGISAPPATWDEFVADAKAVSAKSNGSVSGFAFNPKSVSEMVASFYTEGSSIYNYQTNKLNLTDAGAVKHLQTLYDGVKAGYFSTTDPNVQNDDQNHFVKGQSAFYISSTSSRSFVASALKTANSTMQWNGAVLPHAAGMDPITTLYGGAVLGFKGKSSDEDNATWEVMKYLGSASFQAQWASNTGYVPATNSTISDPTYTAFLNAAPQNKIPTLVYQYAKASEPKIGQWQQIRTDFDNNVFALFQNPSGDPAATLKTIEENGNKLLAAK